MMMKQDASGHTLDHAAQELVCCRLDHDRKDRDSRRFDYKFDVLVLAVLVNYLFYFFVHMFCQNNSTKASSTRGCRPFAGLL